MQKEFLTAALYNQFITYDSGIKLLFKIIKHPHIVVAFKKIEFYTGIAQFGQFA